MERINLYRYVWIGKNSTLVEQYGFGMENKLHGLLYVTGVVQNLLNDPVVAQLPLSSGRAQKLLANLKDFRERLGSDSEPTSGEFEYLKQEFKQLDTLLGDELPTAEAYKVDKKGVFDIGSLIEGGDRIIADGLARYLPEKCKRDLHQAGRCLAFALPTAAAFHAMRATEGAMYAYLQHLGDPRTFSSWGNAIDALEKNSDADTKVVGALRILKNLHRNPVMHPDVELEMEEALELWPVAASVIAAIARSISQREAAGPTCPAAF